MQLIDWPNNLGFGYGQAEVWKHKEYGLLIALVIKLGK